MDFHHTICTLILWRSGKGLLMGKLRQFLTVICPDTVFSFLDDTLVNVNGFSPNLECALIQWRSALGLLMCKIGQYFSELSASSR